MERETSLENGKAEDIFPFNWYELSTQMTVDVSRAGCGVQLYGASKYVRLPRRKNEQKRHGGVSDTNR